MPAGASVSPRRSRRRLPRWALLAAASSCGIHAATLTEHIEIACSQAPATVLRCDYRLPDGGALRSAVAEHAGKVIAGDDVAPYPQPGDTTAVLILVDTSDPARQPVIDRIKQQVATFAAAAGPHHALALASFDTDLHLLAEPGTSAAEITRAARSLEATGRTTELYRNVRDAVRLLGRARHSRRTLVILSDGLAEDYAYHHEDVVELALELGVTIHSIGYPRSVAQSVALQTIRRLSDETGGMYVQAAHLDYSIPDGVFARMLAASDSGGTLEFDLDALIDAGATGALDLSLAFQTERQSFIVLAPVRLPKTAAPASAAEPPAAPLPAPLAPALGTRPRIAPPADRAPALWPWFAVLTVLTLLVLVAVVVAFRRVRQRLDAPPTDAGQSALAFLVMHGDPSERHVIDKTPWRIGRGRNNDLCIADHSVSRLHAEVRSNEDGRLMLHDLESLNGVFVNDNRIDAVQLREGDSVDIGDVRLRFTLRDEDYASEEPTVLVRTHTPVTPG